MRWFLVACLVVFTGCQTSPRFSSRIGEEKAGSTSSVEQTLGPEQERLVKIVNNLLGTPYCYGGTSPECLDCSGFVQTVFDRLGYRLPRVSRDQFTTGVDSDLRWLAVGDLLFYDLGKSNGIDHVAIYMGKNQIVHASSSRGVVRDPLNSDYFTRRFVGARRVLRDKPM